MESSFLSETVILAVVSLIGTIFTGVMGYMLAKLNRMDTTTKDTNTVGKQTHALVNSSMGVQLKLNAVSSKKLAFLTKDPDDQALADLAEKMLHEHELKQRSVDKKRTGDC